MVSEAVYEVGHNLYQLKENLENKSGDTEALFREVHEGYDRLPPKDQKQLNQAMVETGILPELAVEMWDHFDKDGDGKVTKREIERTLRDDEDPTVRMVGDYMLENFDEIDSAGSDLLGVSVGLGDGSIDKENIGEFNKEIEEKHPDAVHEFSEAPEGEEEDEEGDAGEDGKDGGDDDDDDSSRDNSELSDQDDCVDALEDKNASPQEKLAAVEKLAELGVREVTITDENGQSMTFRVVVQEIGPGRKYVHLFDAQTNQIVLRGINSHGQYEKEAGVEFVGDRWSETHGGHPLLGN